MAARVSRRFDEPVVFGIEPEKIQWSGLEAHVVFGGLEE
jgi:hypothetical protein